MHTHRCVVALRECIHTPLTHTGLGARVDIFKRKTIKKWLSPKRNEDETLRSHCCHWWECTRAVTPWLAITAVTAPADINLLSPDHCSEEESVACRSNAHPSTSTSQLCSADLSYGDDKQNEFGQTGDHFPHLFTYMQIVLIQIEKKKMVVLLSGQ